MRRKASLRKERERERRGGKGLDLIPDFEAALRNREAKLKRTFSVSSLISRLLLIVALLDDHIKQRFGQTFK